MTTFRKAVKYDAKLRLALIGPSGSGKTMTALILGKRLAETTGTKLAVIDTERGSASKYADAYEFDVLELESYHPTKYVEAIEAAGAAGYGVLVVDSLSHAWAGKDGALELVDREAAKMKSPNGFAAWRTITPLHNKLVDAMTGSGLHLIVTMRSKMEHIQTTDDRGRTVIKKVGMQPIQREGLEYEFDVVGDMDTENTLVVSKTRCSALTGGVYPKPTEELADTLIAWLKGETPPPPVHRNGTKPQKATGEGSTATLTDLKVLNRSRTVKGKERVTTEMLEQYVSAKFSGKGPRELTANQVHDLADWLATAPDEEIAQAFAPEALTSPQTARTAPPEQPAVVETGAENVDAAWAGLGPGGGR